LNIVVCVKQVLSASAEVARAGMERLIENGYERVESSLRCLVSVVIRFPWKTQIILGRSH